MAQNGENGDGNGGENSVDDFIHIISHDLKEPLRSIQNFSHILLEDYAGKLDQDGQEYLAIIYRCVRRLQQQIDSLSRYACASRRMLALDNLSLDSVIRDVRESLHSLIDERSAELRVDGSLPELCGDYSCLVEIMVNLVQNAIKYNDSKTPVVEIGLLQTADGNGAKKEYTVYVRDNGIGIPKEHQDLAFKMFRRLHPATSYGGGTGSGLAIARKLVEHYGGRIWVESERGQGSTFFFTMPDAQAGLADGQEAMPADIPAGIRRREENAGRTEGA